MTFRSRRLQALLGAPVDQATYDDFFALIGLDTAREADDLDFKATYGGPKSDMSDAIAVDVATFANSRGGVVVVGIAEKNGVPVAAPGIDLTDAFIREVHTAIAERIRPAPLYEVKALPEDPDSSDNPKRGILLIMVPASLEAPHAVIVRVPKDVKGAQGALKFPYRHESQKFWMTEPQLATTYRRRFTHVLDQAARLATISDEITKAIEQMPKHREAHIGALLVVSLVPDMPGDFPLNREVYNRFQHEVRQEPVLVGTDDNLAPQTAVGSRRLIRYSDAWFITRIELHCDGSGSVAIQLPTRSGQSPTGEDPPGVWDTLIAWWTASALLYLARHAIERANASGIAATTASLHSYTPVSNDVSVLGGWTSIWTPGVFGSSRQHGNQRLTKASGRADFLLDVLANDGQPLAAAAGELVSDLLQCFGAVEARQFAQDGTLNLQAWGSESEFAKAWANQAGISVEP